MTDRGKYPEGFISILESRSLVGKAIYGERWPKIDRRFQAHDRSEARLVQAAKKQDQDGVSTSITKWRKAQAQTYPEWARLLTEMDRLVASGRLRLYLWQQDHLPVPLAGSLIVGDGPEQIWLRQHIFITGRTAVMPSGGDLAIPRAISIVDHFRDADSAEVIVLERGVHQALLEVGYLDESDSARTANGSSGERRGRKPKWDWDGAVGHLLEVANDPDGLPEMQADIERLVAKWFSDNVGTEPVTSAIRKHVSTWCNGVLQKASKASN